MVQYNITAFLTVLIMSYQDVMLHCIVSCHIALQCAIVCLCYVRLIQVTVMYCEMARNIILRYDTVAYEMVAYFVILQYNVLCHVR